MTDHHNYYAFRARYFPSFLGSMFLATFSIATTTVQATQAWFREVDGIALYQVLAIVGAAMVLALGGLMITRGRTWGLWVVFAMMAMNFTVVLFTFPTQAGGALLFIYALGLLFPLLCLLLLNSRRHREMRAGFAALRAEREESSHEASRQAALEEHRESLRKKKPRRQ